MKDTKSSIIRSPVRVYAILALIAALALLPYLNKSMWRDEGASLYSSRLSWSGLWRESQVVDRVFLLYYAILHFWISISDNIEWIRLLSLLAFALTVFLVGRLANRLGGLWCGVLATLLTATSPLMIESALDARPYALSALMATVSIMSLLRWLRDDQIRWMWCFTLAGIATLLLQMFSVLAPLAVLGMAFALEPQKFRRRWGVVAAPVGLLLTVTIVFVGFVIGQTDQISWIAPLTIKSIAPDMAGPASGAPVLSTVPIYAVVVAVLAFVVLGVCVWAWKQKKLSPTRLELDSFGLTLAWAALPTVGLIVISIAKPIYVERYVTASVPGMAIGIALLTVNALQVINSGDTRGRRSFMGRVGLVAALLILAVNAQSVSRTAMQNLRGAAQFLTQHVGAGGEVVIPDHSLTAGIDYYLPSGQRTLPSWPQTSQQPLLEGIDLKENRMAFSRASPNIWLVNYGNAAGVRTFIGKLTHHGYVRISTQRISGNQSVFIDHFQRSHG